MRSKIYLVLIFFSFSFNSCSDDYYPKPKAYVRFDLPEKNYLTFDMNYPFTFNYPVYALVNKASSPNSEPYC